MDRITILELKIQRLGASAQDALQSELSYAREQRQRLLPRSEHLRELAEELAGANRVLWDVEEELRECERRHEFGPRFVELARRVYVTNDRRAALKRAIDELVGSAIREYKSHPLPKLSKRP